MRQDGHASTRRRRSVQATRPATRARWCLDRKIDYPNGPLGTVKRRAMSDDYFKRWSRRHHAVALAVLVAFLSVEAYCLTHYKMDCWPGYTPFELRQSTICVKATAD